MRSIEWAGLDRVGGAWIKLGGEVGGSGWSLAWAVIEVGGGVGGAKVWLHTNFKCISLGCGTSWSIHEVTVLLKIGFLSMVEEQLALWLKILGESSANIHPV